MGYFNVIIGIQKEDKDICRGFAAIIASDKESAQVLRHYVDGTARVSKAAVCAEFKTGEDCKIWRIHG
ncbi:hypothetical protein [Legionella septentrionalis]|uniref:Uncharacterized protein n=1 Tax=Legionella septentrionalis TaxID=2498109 RepID=A0A433JKK5_9GAMM|nr:hypothetical protein [Legionella septentrionalis]RUQ89235.1 hypothetical protein EKM59_03915 [Legionella septentrionalis]RUR00530.1 hypothetical protein ELY11_01895 [Legionella septentrionalis]RUR11731.1 hypothetical protein ELY14_00355 [Legionella septentrionalis]RUR17419.1 hypothetical protein ELY10_00355 [Legionella septentrionalis]